MRPHSQPACGQLVEGIRGALLQNQRILEWDDLGAGFQGKTHKKVQRSIAQIARNSAKSPKEGAFLYRLCAHYQPQRLLEFGTNLGISTLYMMSAVPHAQCITVEGIAAFAAVAADNFAQAGFAPKQLVGEFAGVLAGQNNFADFRPDFVYLDGNHQYEATVAYFRALLPHIADGGMVVLDDIYWSAGMKQAWREISSLDEVSVSIDLFHFGICLIRKRQAKEHFVLRGF